MADEIIDFEGLRLSISDFSKGTSKISCLKQCDQSFCIGQLIDIRIDLPLSSEGKKKFSNVQQPRSPVSQNLLTLLKRQLSAGIDVKCNVSGVPDVQEIKPGDDRKTTWSDCNVKSSYHETSSFASKKTESSLSKERDVYHIPMQVRVPEMSSTSHHVELTVHAKPISRQGPSWLSSPTRQEPGILGGSSTNGEQEQQKGKKVCEKLKIIHPPSVQFQQKNVGGKQMIFLQVKNVSTHSISIEDCSVLPDACPKSSGSQPCVHCKTGAGDQRRTVCVLHANLVKLVAGESKMFPMELAPGECVSMCYVIKTSNCVENLIKDDLCLEAHIRWCIPGNIQYDNDAVIVTTYRLPVLRIKRAYFVMCATCDTDEIKKGDSFVVNYSITNKLQDFLSIKLLWNPILIDDSKEAARNLQNIQQGLVCQDPCTQLGPCAYGSTVHAKVRFQTLRSGLYEVCKHLKINLRYMVPSSETVSLASPSSQTSTLSDDHLAVASEELWRSRSGSGSSFNDPRIASAEERRLSFANKSYSFGDLGPTKSSESADSNNIDKSKQIDRSPCVVRNFMRPQLIGGKFEQMLLCPENFIKNSCLVYVK